MEDLEMRFSDEQERKWDSQIDRALRRAAGERPRSRIESVSFDEAEDMIRIAVDDGVVLAIPRTNLQGVANATVEEVRDMEIIMSGTAIDWPRLDMPMPLDGLREGRYGNEQWMAELSLRRQESLKKAS